VLGRGLTVRGTLAAVNSEALLARLRDELDEGGLRGSFLVRDLGSGREIGIEPDLSSRPRRWSRCR